MAILAPLAVFAIDRLPVHEAPPAVVAALDEPAHIATAAAFLGAIPPPVLRAFVWGVLLGAVVIDLDHLPAVLGNEVLTQGTGRPYSHSLLAIGLLLLVALPLPAAWRSAAFGAAFGVAAHLIRDMATPAGSTPGVPLFWPVSAREVRLDYGAYATLLLLAGGLAVWRARPRWPSRTRGV